EAAAHPGRPRDRVLGPPAERVVGRRRIDPVRAEEPVRSAGGEPPPVVLAVARLQPDQRDTLLLRRVRLRPPEGDGLLPGRVAVVCDPGRERAPGAPARVPLLVGLRVRGGRPWSPPDGRRQLPGRLPSLGPVHHGPKRVGGNRDPRRSSPGRRLPAEPPELPTG